MIDHVSLPTADLERGGDFYDSVLAALGIRRVLERAGAIGYGAAAGAVPFFWLLAEKGGKVARPGYGVHVSFAAHSRAQVHAFHDAALAAGGRSAGAPGDRPEYSAGFYGAFVFDLDGFKIEAVHRSGAAGT